MWAPMAQFYIEFFYKNVLKFAKINKSSNGVPKSLHTLSASNHDMPKLLIYSK